MKSLLLVEAGPRNAMIVINRSLNLVVICDINRQVVLKCLDNLFREFMVIFVSFDNG